MNKYEKKIEDIRRNILKQLDEFAKYGKSKIYFNFQNNTELYNFNFCDKTVLTMNSYLYDLSTINRYIEFEYLANTKYGPYVIFLYYYDILKNITAYSLLKDEKIGYIKETGEMDTSIMYKILDIFLPELNIEPESLYLDTRDILNSDNDLNYIHEILNEYKITLLSAKDITIKNPNYLTPLNGTICILEYLQSMIDNIDKDEYEIINNVKDIKIILYIGFDITSSTKHPKKIIEDILLCTNKQVIYTNHPYIIKHLIYAANKNTRHKSCIPERYNIIIDSESRINYQDGEPIDLEISSDSLIYKFLEYN